MLTALRKVYALFDHTDRVRVGWLVVLMLLNGIAESLSIGLIIPFLSLVTTAVDTWHPLLRRFYGAGGFTSQGQFVVVMAVVLALVFLLRNLFQSWVQHYQLAFIWDGRTGMTARFYENYLALPYSFHVGRNSATIVRNLSFAIADVFAGSVMTSVVIISEGFLVIAVIGLLMLTNWRVTLLAAAGFGLMVAVMQRMVSARLHHWGQQTVDSQAGMIRIATQTLAGIKEIKVLDRGRFFADEFRRAAATNSQARQRVGEANQLPKLAIETVALWAILGALAFIVVTGGSLTGSLPVLGVFGLAAFRLMPSFNRIAVQLQGMRVSHATLDQLMADAQLFRDNPTPHRSGAAAAIPFARDIRFDNVGFGYAGHDRPALDGVSLTIERGSSVAFVGASGSGKSTILNLLLGLYEPTSGAILVDGRPIADDIAGWQRNLGMIPQDVFLLDDSLRRNIALGLPPGADDEEKLRRVVVMAQLDGVVARLPAGLDSPVGERGLQLSGGERQRVGIARALYNDAEVLIMDEATSALDAETEAAVTGAIETLKGIRTLVIVAHRLSTVRDCNRIFFVDGGRVVDSGTFAQLEESNAAFARLIQKMRLTPAGLES